MKTNQFKFESFPMLRAIPLALTAALAFSAPAHALQAENLLVTKPKAYKVGFQKKSAKEMMSEWVPDGESVNDWTEMVTVQIFFNLRDVTPAQYRARMEKLWGDACPGSQVRNVNQGAESLYPTMTWALRCPANPKTGKPEYTWMKAVQGRDSFYLVQKAYKFGPTAEQVASWARFLDDVRVCDTRVPAQSCPKGM
ncbi:hypothetical protein V1282_001626 [Nitrobacteraceae bacterium AZCC 2146]